MKITVEIPAPIYRLLKSRAASDGRTAKELILRGVEQVLKEPRRKRGRRVKLPLVPSKVPGTLRLDNAKIYELLFPHDTNRRLAEGLDDIREGRVQGPFRSASALLRSLHRTKKIKKP
jgi:hypothetical protein